MKNENNYHADLVISLGDQTEDSYDSEYRDNFIKPLQPIIGNSPLYTVIGNHDTHDESGNTYRENFALPSDGASGGVATGSEDYYSFNYANIHFVVLSTETKYTASLNTQALWLEKDLKSNKLPWVVVSFHRPIHSGGHHNTDASGTAEKQRVAWLGLLEKYGVDLILTGHNHVYERSMFIKTADKDIDDINESDMMDTGYGRSDFDNAYRKETGSGKPGYVMIEVCAPNPSALIEDYDKYTHVYKVYGSPYEIKHDKDRMSGFVKLSFNNNVLDVFTYSHDGVELYDYFTIIKSPETTGIEKSDINNPEMCAINNFPNPFNPSTNIEFTLSQLSKVRVRIYNTLGIFIDEITNGNYGRGRHVLQWIAKDKYGNPLPSGIYIGIIEAGKYANSTKMLFVK